MNPKAPLRAAARHVQAALARHAHVTQAKPVAPAAPAREPAPHVRSAHEGIASAKQASSPRAVQAKLPEGGPAHRAPASPPGPRQPVAQPFSRGVIQRAAAAVEAQASFSYCSSWDKVFKIIKDGLHAHGYPSGLKGGEKNVCCIVCYYSGADVPEVIVGVNEGSGGAHSEPVGLVQVQHRKLAAGKDVYLFTERAPCQSCQESLARWAKTFRRDIVVQYVTPYSDTDGAAIDVVMQDAKAQPAGDAKASVFAMRKLFK